ncbi:MAG: TldD/PmbA family protein [Planctomycetes bacterium]|nr:TldD/PmbA family protein [Planctomycetota bacterium]
MHPVIEIAKSRVDAAEVFEHDYTSLSAQFEAGQLSNLGAEQHSEIGLRILKDGRAGFASSTRKDEPENLVSRAAEVSKFGKPSSYKFSASGNANLEGGFDDALAKWNIDFLVETCKPYAAKLQALAKDAVVDVSMSRTIETTRIATTDGADYSYRRTTGGGALHIKVVSEGDFLNMYSGHASTKADADFEKHFQEIASDFEAAQTIQAIKPGKYRVIFGKRVVRDLLRPIFTCLGGKAVAKGLSPWRDMLGSQLFDPRLTIIDNPVRPGGASFYPVDDEGVPTSVKSILEAGRIDHFFADIETAAELGIEPSGNAQRGSGAAIPGAGPYNCEVSPGDVPIADILKDSDGAIYVEGTMGMQQGNLYAGQISGNVMLGYVVENGRKARRIKNAMIGLNVFDALKNNLFGLSKEVFASGSLYTPAIVLDGVTISV